MAKKTRRSRTRTTTPNPESGETTFAMLIRRLWKPILAAAVLGAVVLGIGGPFVLGGTWRSTAGLLIAPSEDIVDREDAAATLQSLFAAPAVHAAAADTLTAAEAPTAEELRESIAIEVGSPRYLEVGVEWTDPDIAQESVNALIEAVRERIVTGEQQRIEDRRAVLQTQIETIDAELQGDETTDTDATVDEARAEIESLTNDIISIQDDLEENDITVEEATARVDFINSQIIALRSTVDALTLGNDTSGSEGLRTLRGELRTELARLGTTQVDPGFRVFSPATVGQTTKTSRSQLLIAGFMAGAVAAFALGYAWITWGEGSPRRPS